MCVCVCVCVCVCARVCFTHEFKDSEEEPTQEQSSEPTRTVGQNTPPTDTPGPRHGTRGSSPRRGSSSDSDSSDSSRESRPRPGSTRETIEMGNNGDIDRSEDATTSTIVTPILPTTDSTPVILRTTATPTAEDGTEISASPSTATILTMDVTSPAPATSSPTAANKTMCEVLEELSKKSGCFVKTKKPCNSVQCFDVIEGTPIEYNAVLLLCKELAALHFTLRQGDRDLVNKEIDHSQEIEIPEPLGVTLNFTLDHFNNDVIGVQVYT